MKWNSAGHLPTPGIELVVKLSSGLELPASRPNYVESRDADPNYVGLDGVKLRGVVSWRYK